MVIIVSENYGCCYEKERKNIQCKIFAAKKILDIFGSLFAIILFSTLIIIIAIVIKIEDGGPIIFVQERVGQNGVHFKMYKFRSMLVGADAMKNNLMSKNEIQGAMFKMRHDPRVTRCGKYLRELSLDEIPQFFNVLQGGMSLVGPRPPLPDEVSHYTDHDKKRLEVKPGLTGLWQVSGRSNLSFEEMVHLDLKYIDNRSIFTDIKIIFKTAEQMIKKNNDGAF